ncbi:putative mitochondrial phosphate carrier protein Pic2/Mir1 [Helianthus annuus]|nr:putative mitochondrial phosphate carrier protein Pic2/Mir1 [Helianthus annuus]
MDSSRQSLIPNFLYSPKGFIDYPANSLTSSRFSPLVAPTSMSPKRGFVVQAPSEPRKIAMFSPAYYGACTAGGILSCGLTHMAVTPLDLVKCNMQVD